MACYVALACRTMMYFEGPLPSEYLRCLKESFLGYFVFSHFGKADTKTNVTITYKCSY